MRTLLIAPSFMAVFSLAIFSVGWLIMTGGDMTAPDFTVQPDRGAFVSWSEQLPFDKPAAARISESARERLEELGQY